MVTAGQSQRGNLRRPVVNRARKLRREMSLPEVLLWQQLKARPHGLKFRKQHPIEPYVVDFYCPAKRLVVEVDGIAHDMGENPERDLRKDAFLAERKLAVLRIPAKDILKDVTAAAQAIADYADGMSSRDGGLQ
ncbi:endonuclease domain-containing protein [Parasphingorhabdus sp.]|uniref:endonuclease domain-containing protein n=1 Tax=Parasphingorhabdus sp. TaxID=2709688 RepID=UPI002B26CC1F|nr:endonuclease domain-containing protein [Parasphingorhabdus sp.]|tara:strand:- start:81 stop:482 length:402 start_codon:yes stop_codon:yes gene_type:complete